MASIEVEKLKEVLMQIKAALPPNVDAVDITITWKVIGSGVYPDVEVHYMLS